VFIASSIFKQPISVIASAAKQSIVQQEGESWIASLRSQ